MPTATLDTEPVLLGSIGRKVLKSLIVIPARMESERLPGKPMLMAGRKPLVEWTWLRATLAGADHVIVATPDRVIGRWCQDRGIPWRPTRSDHWCGTGRCAEVLEQVRAAGKAEVDVVVNWQVDEPLVEPTDVAALIRMVREARFDPDAIFTLVGPDDPGWVKAAVSNDGQCHWFSRAEMAGASGHCGVYAFTADTLAELGGLPQSRLSEAERLEQLAWIEQGYKVFCLHAERLPLSINTRADFESFKQLMERGNVDG